MKIEKFKKISKGKYMVFFDRDDEYVLYEDVILKHNLLLQTNITLKELDEILKDNEYAKAYNLALSLISFKLRTEEEVKKYLEKKEIDENVIEEIIKRLKKEKYLNEEVYIHAFVTDKVNLSNHGPIKIKNELIKKGLDENNVNKEIEKIEEDIWKEKIEKIIFRKVKNNKKLSTEALKQKIKTDLITLGYPYNMIEELLIIEQPDDIEIAKKEYQKLYNKYSKKYSGHNLNSRIRNEMYKKGFYNINYAELIDE